MKKHSKMEPSRQNAVPTQPKAETVPVLGNRKGSSPGPAPERFWIGLDLGDTMSTFCVLDAGGEVVKRGTVKTRAGDLTRAFGAYEGSLLALEVGGQSAWISRALESAGLEVVVANARKVRLISESQHKNDKHDAEALARLLRSDRKLLSPVVHRSEAAQKDLTRIRARAGIVEARTKLINSVRGLSKALGKRLAACAADKAGVQLVEGWEAELASPLLPLLTLIEACTLTIQRYDDAIEENGEQKYPDIGRLTQVPGVGTLTATAFVLTLDDKDRIRQSRQAGPVLGLTPAQRQSSNSDPELRISKEGDHYLRSLLVQCAQWILSRRGPDSELKRFGQRVAGIDPAQEAGAKKNQYSRKRKKVAVVAVARKLAVLLHRLWVSGEKYDPFYASKAARAGSRDAA